MYMFETFHLFQMSENGNEHYNPNKNKQMPFSICKFSYQHCFLSFFIICVEKIVSYNKLSTEKKYKKKTLKSDPNLHINK